MSNGDFVGSGYPDRSWHGTRAWKPDWSGNALAFLLCGRHARAGTAHDDFVYVAMNMHWDALPFELPQLPKGVQWRVFVNTSVGPPADAHNPGEEPVPANQESFLVGGRSVAILVGR
jgi:isoamylase